MQAENARTMADTRVMLMFLLMLLVMLMVMESLLVIRMARECDPATNSQLIVERHQLKVLH